MMERRRAIILFVVACGALSCSPSRWETSDSPVPAIFISNATLIDGSGGPPQLQTNLLIVDEKIEAIGAHLEPPMGAKEIDATGKFLVPGLIDCHVHLDASMLYQLSPEERDALVEYTPRAFLYNGVTTVLDVGSHVTGHTDWIWERRAEQQAGRLVSPRIYAVGHNFRLKIGWGPEGDRALSDVEEARGRAREQVTKGNDGFKITIDDVLLSPGEDRNLFESMVRVVSEEAGAAERPVFVHAINRREYERGVEMRPRAIIHGLEDPLVEGDALVQQLLASDTYVVSTLTVFESFISFDGHPEGFEDPVLEASVPGFALQKMRGLEFMREEKKLFATQGNFPKTAPARHDPIAWVREKLPVFTENAEKMHRAGVKLAVGTDGGGRSGYNFQGYQTPRELELLVVAGLTPMEALVAGTRRGAEVIGIEDRLGTLEVGKGADLLILTANPLQDISNVRSIEAVVQAGKLYPRDELAYRN